MQDVDWFQVSKEDIEQLAGLPGDICIVIELDVGASLDATHADPYHPTSSSEWKWSVIFGIAVDRIVLSCVFQRRPKLRMSTHKGKHKD